MKLAIELQLSDDLHNTDEVVKMLNAMLLVFGARYLGTDLFEVGLRLPSHPTYGAILGETRHRETQKVLYRMSLASDDVNPDTQQTEYETQNTAEAVAFADLLKRATQ